MNQNRKKIEATIHLRVEKKPPAPVKDNKIDPGAGNDGDEKIKIIGDDHDRHLLPEFVDEVKNALEAKDEVGLAGLVKDLHSTEQADILTILPNDLRLQFIELLDSNFDFEALAEVDEAVRLQIVKELPQIKVASGISGLEANDAIYIIEDLDEADQIAILSQIPFVERLALKRGLDYPEDSAGRLMHTEFVATPPFWTVARTINFIRNTKDLPDEFYQVFVVDPSFHFVGTIALDKLLRSDNDSHIGDIMTERKYTVKANEDKEEIAYLFQRYDLVSIAVVDDNNRLVGVITFDDVAEVIQEEAVEDMVALGGVGDEEVSDSVMSTVKNRFNWLLINLGTAILASVVISQFDTTLNKMVALAILMPIVASMGGNAGTQTMTVTVRALAVRDINMFNLYSFILRETMVGIINGVLFSAIIAAIVIFWFENLGLGIVIGLAMIINMFAAGVSGIMIPIALNRMRIDPAVSSTVFLTTVTDVVGFLAFLGLAGWYFAVF